MRGFRRTPVIRASCADERMGDSSDGDPEPIVLIVNGETFRARADAQQPGAWHVDWVSGPNVGYGFTTRRSDHQWESREQLDRGVRSFLDEIDPATGYLRD